MTKLIKESIYFLLYKASYLAPGGQASQTGAQTTGGGGAAAFLPPGGQAPQTGTAFLQPAPGTSSLVAPRRQTNSLLSPQLLRFLIVYLLAQSECDDVFFSEIFEFISLGSRIPFPGER